MVATTVRPLAARLRRLVMTPNADALSKPLLHEVGRQSEYSGGQNGAQVH